jgi:outer membrane protein W
LTSFWSSRGVGIDLEVDDTFFFHAGGGLEIFLTDHIALNFDARYAWAEADIDEKRTTGVTTQRLGDTINLNSAFIGAGFKFFF